MVRFGGPKVAIAQESQRKKNAEQKNAEAGSQSSRPIGSSLGSK